MKMMYLKCDVVGAASGIVYGRKGDHITVLEIVGGMATCDNGFDTIHVRVEKLSEKFVAREQAADKNTIECPTGAGQLRPRRKTGR